MDKEKKVKDTCKFGSKLAMEKELGLLRIRNIQNFTSYDCLKIIETRRLHCLLSLFMRFTYCKLTAPCTDVFNYYYLCRCKVNLDTFGTDNNVFAPLHLKQLQERLFICSGCVKADHSREQSPNIRSDQRQCPLIQEPRCLPGEQSGVRLVE
jgi:hypothetical protein